MEAVGAGPTAWLPVDGGRDGPVDGSRRRWTTRSWRQLSTTGPRVVHGSEPVHPRVQNEPSTELSPDVGEVRTHGNVGRPIGHRRVVTRAVGNRWASPPAHNMKRTVTDEVTWLITGSGPGAASVAGRTTSGRVSCATGRSCPPDRCVAAGCGQRPRPAPGRGRRAPVVHRIEVRVLFTGSTCAVGRVRWRRAGSRRSPGLAPPGEGANRSQRRGGESAARDAARERVRGDAARERGSGRGSVRRPRPGGVSGGRAA
jgi:hypothetical protein